MPSQYVRPVQAEFRRQDQGVDFQGKPGGNVVSIGTARVDYVKDDPGGFGKAIYYTLLDGRYRGQQIYVGHAQPLVTPGQYLQAGTPVAQLLEHGLGNAGNLAGWTEIGFAKDGVPQPGSSGQARKFFASLGTSGGQTPVHPSPGPVARPTAAAPAPPGSSSPLTLPTGPPDPTFTHPLVLPPGSGGLEDVPASLWRQISGQQNASPETLAYAQNASIASGG